MATGQPITDELERETKPVLTSASSPSDGMQRCREELQVDAVPTPTTFILSQKIFCAAHNLCHVKPFSGPLIVSTHGVKAWELSSVSSPRDL